MDETLYLRLFFIVLCILLGLFFKKSTCIFIFDTLILILLTGLYNGQMDLYFYKSEYYSNYISSSPFEKLYEFLSVFCNRIGISFEMYHFLLAAISISVFAGIIKKTSEEPAYCMSMMFGFATFEYAWQIKSLVASAIIVFAIYFFLKDIHSIKQQVGFLLLISVAAGFHFSSLVFGVLLLLPYIEIKCIKKWMMVYIVVTCYLAPIIMQFLISKISSLAVYSNRLSVKTFLLSSIWQIAGVMINLYLYKYSYREINQNNSNLNEKYNWIYYIYAGSFLLLFMIPFYCFSNVILRIPRTFMIFSIVLSSKARCIPNRKWVISFRECIRGLFALYMIFSYIAFYVIFSKNELITTYLSDNIFLDFLF